MARAIHYCISRWRWGERRTNQYDQNLGETLMDRRLLFVAIVAFTANSASAEPPPLRFEVRLSSDFKADVTNGRVLVVLGSPESRDPRSTIGRTGMTTPPVLGADAHAPAADRLIATLDSRNEIFPIESLAKLKPVKYAVQAAVHLNRDLNFRNSPGDLYGPVVTADLNPNIGGVVSLEINARLPDESLPADTDRVKFLKFPSKLL